jgi:glucan phosphoethanolaminetransferase (alkaline phosphatase superfamily)
VERDPPIGPAAPVPPHSSTAPSSRLGILGLCIFSALLLSPSALALFLSDVPPEILPPFPLSLLLWSFWVALWGKPYRACLAATPFLLATPVVDYLLLTYHAQLRPQVIGIILETNTEESMQYLRELWWAIALAYASMIATGYVALRMMRHHAVQWPPRWRLAALAGAPTIIGALHCLYQPGESAGAGLVLAPDVFSPTPLPLELDSLRVTSPFGVILQVADAVQGERKIAAVQRLNVAFRFGARQALQSPDRQVYVLIIGESARKDRWSLNGYTRQTSPRLQRESNLVSFSDVITVAPWTRASVPVILTRKPAQKALDSQFSEHSLVSAFREAGFATYWMSTQAPLGAFDAAFSMYAKEAEHVAYFNITGSWSETPPDGVMLEPLKQTLEAPTENRQLIVIHTLGSHMEYRRRYPDEFDKFRPSAPKSDPAIWHDQAYTSKLNNAYDNSILYTDYFLSEVIAAVKASGRPLATILYVSDHGEDLYDRGCENWGHGHVTPAGLRIPLFFWYSDAYQQMFPDKVATLRRHREEPLTTESVFPLMLDSAEIHFPGENPTRSVMSTSFARPATRLVRSLGSGDTIDFDHAHSNGQCQLVN